jgi:putative PEP-CTERM system histidine kinase
MSLDFKWAFVSAAGAATLAAGKLLRRKRTASDWTFSAGMFALAAEQVCTGMTAQPPFVTDRMIAWQQWRMVAASFLPGIWIWFSLAYARGNAREFMAKWRVALAAAFILPVALALACRSQLVAGMRPGGVRLYWIFPLGWSGFVVNLMLLGAAILIVMNLERTFRASVGTMRWRIKFMLMGIGMLFIVRIYTTTQVLLYDGVDLSWEGLTSGTLLVAAVLTLVSFFRAGRLDLDVYPSHSLIQGSLTILLAGIYLLIVAVFANVAARLGGNHALAYEGLVVLVALVLFVLLLQSDRLRMLLGRWISRHFQRPLYDYRTVWRRFTESTASRVDQDELCRSLVRLAADVFQTLSVAIWIVDEKKEGLQLAASTFLSESKGRELALDRAEAAEVLAHFQLHPEPAQIETAEANFAGLLRRIHPSQFLKHEQRVCLPLTARNEVLALVILGDRVGGADFSPQDFDMLKCVGDHATASLLNVQLAHRLLQAKELEAFQTMAAFFVHDLKNAASTLSLMLKNLPVHFEDPAFREDALRGVSKSVAHINHVIGRLSLLRHELKINAVESDFNEIVRQVVAPLEGAPDFHVAQEFSFLPKLTLDREQIAKVVTNLVLNAQEAGAGRGTVRVATHQDKGWAVLTVQDEGCGMSPDFISHSLFRPFQTTKKNGLGIGMFQSKMIVEVHGGRIAVTSQPSRGTTFQVFLPVQRITG